MKKAFLDAYERELALLYERARVFGEDYPGLAERLGGLTRNNMDPAVAGLLEGAAFMAARVQLKIGLEYETFTSALLEELLPNYLTPTPSAMLIEAAVDWRNEDLVRGLRFEAGSYLDARYRERDQRISCRFRLSAPLEIWPLRIARVEVAPTPARLVSLGVPVTPQMTGGLVLGIERPAPSGSGLAPLGDLALRDLTVHLAGTSAETGPLFEQIFRRSLRIYLRWHDAHGDPVLAPLPLSQLGPIGLDPGESFFPEDDRMFRGFVLLREFHMFSQKFLGFRLKGLDAFLPRIRSGALEVIFAMGGSGEDLAGRIEPAHFRLGVAPAVNLFEEQSSQLRLDTKRHDYLVAPDTGPASHYEVHRVLDVQAHHAGVTIKTPVHALYDLPPATSDPARALFYTSRRRPRRLSDRERRFGAPPSYLGSETLISLHEPEGLDSSGHAQRLQLRLLCSNRHLPAWLPLADSEADFRLNDNVEIALRCIAGPSAPAPGVLETAAPKDRPGSTAWRLISFLSMGISGLLDSRGEADGAAPLRRMLELFADPANPVVARQIRGLTDLAARPVTRMIERGGIPLPARGVELGLTLDENAFEGGNALPLLFVLDRFLAEFAAVNSFTQLVVTSQQRGPLIRFAPRSGEGPLI